MEIVTPKDAKARGLAKYYTGKPCTHGHMSERYTNSGTCIECIYLANGQTLDSNKGASAESRRAVAAARTVAFSKVPEQRLRAYREHVAPLQMMADAFAIAECPELTPADLLLNKAPIKPSGETAMYAFRFPLAAWPVMLALSTKYLETRAVDFSHVRAHVIRQAQDLALEDPLRAAGAPGEWDFK